ncbi:MAG TPA: gamma-glutamyltransferase family protein, partial [Thermomicrobiales bacterium]|nr:gamma-glutamyltransferase family protein [Thermomicrobiales bacterium]
KREAVAAGGMITCLHPLAADAAVAVLRDGGNAIDAAVVAGFVLGVVEPMMSGFGGGGILVARLAGGRTVVIEHGPQAPAAATPDMFELAGEGTAGFYGWPSVKDDANIVGPRSIAVPGTVAGLSLALERFGTLSLADALAPAIRLAEEGFPPDWSTAMAAAVDMKYLCRYPATAAIFLPDGIPVPPHYDIYPSRLVQRDLAKTLRQLARDGAESFYRGDLARRLTADLGPGAMMTPDDLAAYEPRVYEGADALIGSYRGLDVFGAPYEGGAATTAEILGLLDRHPAPDRPGSALAYHLTAEAARRAFGDRFAYLADHQQVSVPWAALRDPTYLTERAAEIDPERATVEVGAGQVTSPVTGHTTHLCVVDAQRNAVALTQTLLDHFGSRVVAPGTGVVLNNGMMWFDPRPGRPNSVAGGKRALTAMSPLVLCRDGQPVLAVGGSGGRKILTAVAQVVGHVVDHGLGPQAAIQVPRVHCEGLDTLIDSGADPDAIADLKRRGHRVKVMTESPVHVNFALPNAIAIGTDGLLRGGVDPLRPGTARGI